MKTKTEWAEEIGRLHIQGVLAYVDAREKLVSDIQSDAQQVESDAQMPGAWICPKCGFTLQKNVLNIQGGKMTADGSPLNEKCQNDGVLMRPLTWSEANAGLFKAYAEAMSRQRQLETALGAAVAFMKGEWSEFTTQTRLRSFIQEAERLLPPPITEQPENTIERE